MKKYVKISTYGGYYRRNVETGFVPATISAGALVKFLEQVPADTPVYSYSDYGYGEVLYPELREVEE